MMEYKILEKVAFTVMGRKRKFDNENSYQRVPEFWYSLDKHLPEFEFENKVLFARKMKF